MNSIHSPSILTCAHAALLMFGAAISASAADQVVSNTADSGAGSLRQAIIDVGTGETISFDAALDGATITLGSVLTVGKSLTIDASALPSGLTVSGGHATQLFHIGYQFTVEINSLTLAEGSALGGGDFMTQSGGAIWNWGWLTLKNVDVRDNTSAGRGGAIFSTNGISLTILDSSFTGNTANDVGAAICSSGTATITNSTLSDNIGVGRGGAIYNFATMTILSSTLSGNTATGLGGAIGNQGSLSVINSTLSGNAVTADAGGDAMGGAIFNFNQNVALTLRNSTIVGNAAAVGGGLRTQGGTLAIENTIVAGNTASTEGPDIAQLVTLPTPFTITGANFIGNNDTVADKFPAGPLVGTPSVPLDPLLAALGNYGGPTQTRPALAGSPVIDAGVNTANLQPADQRGFPRVIGTVDIGATEDLPSNFVLVDTLIDELDTPATGGTGISLREALRDAPAGGTILFDPALTGGTITLVSGQLTVAHDLNIDASWLSGGLSVSGNDAFRVFQIDAGVTTAISSLTIRDGRAPTGVAGAPGGLLSAGGPGGKGQNGGGILNLGTLTLTACTLNSNTAGTGGTGGRGTDGTPGILSNGTAGGAGGVGGDGGGISNAASGILNMVNCTLAACSGGRGGAGGNAGVPFGGSPRAAGGNGGTGGAGGAIHNLGILTVTACTVSTNVSGLGGTGGNSASAGSGGAGGGIRNANSATLRSVVVAGNSASPGGSAPDYSGAVTSLSFNLTGISDGSSGWSGDLLGTAGSPLDPVLGPLADNGGPTFTMALLAGSPALEMGDPSLTGTDQRGQPRSSRGAVDVGAYEALPFPQEISIESPAGIELIDQFSVVGTYASLGHSAFRTFTIRNAVSAEALTGIAVLINGTHASDFTMSSAPPATTLGGGGVTTFTVQFTPSAAGLRSAFVHVSSNDSDESSFDIQLFGQGIADGTGYDFSGADLTGANLTGLDLSGATSGGITGVPAILPTPWQLIGGYLVGPFANLTNADLAGADLTGVNLSGADLSGADFSGAILTGATLSGTFTRVNTSTDELDTPSSGGSGLSLREALRDAPAGITILFDAALDGGTITLASGQLTVARDVHIDASALAAGLSISGNNAFRVFEVSAGVTAHLSTLAIRDGKAANGANGANGQHAIFQPFGGSQDGTPGGPGANGQDGGAILNSGALTLTACTVGSSAAGNGGNGGTGGNGASAFSSLVYSPKMGGAGGTGGRGGAIYNAASGVLDLTNCTLAGCSAGAGGNGGLGGVNPLSGTRTTGGAAGSGGSGGAIQNDGILTATACTVSTNASGVRGTPGSTFAGNGSGGAGGGISNTNSATLRSVLLAGNTSTPGGSAPDFSGAATSSGFNLVGITDGSSGWNAGNGDLLGTAASPLDPVLGPLADNGGPTFTMALLIDSPALESGDNSLTGTDQRGQPRSSRGAVDIGAYEALPFPPDIAVESPDGVDLVDGISVVESYASLGNSASRTFTIRNVPTRLDLTGVSVTIDGAHAGDFVLTGAPPATTVVSGTATTFTVQFTPGAAGLRSAAVHIASDDPDESPFDITLAGQGISDGVGYDFSGADLTGANLTGLDLSGVISGGITGIPAVIPASWQLIGGYLVGPNVNLTNADLSGFDLTGVDLTGAELTGADLTGADLSGTNITPAQLRSASSTDGVTLAGSDFSGADLSGINLSTADLSGVNLSGAFALVDTTTDELDTPSSGGTGVSLREALRDTPGGISILFDGALSGGTITLGSGQLTVARDGDIDASSLADGIAISGNNASRVFLIDAGVTAEFVSLTITNGKAPNGGNGGNGANAGVFGGPATAGGPGAAGQDGGAIHNSGNLTLTACTVDSSAAGKGGNGGQGGNGLGGNPGMPGGPGGTGGLGGGIYNAAAAVLDLTNSTLAGCSAGAGGNGGLGGFVSGSSGARAAGGAGGNGGAGGAIHNDGILTVTASTISTNASGVRGTGAASNGANGSGGAGGGIRNTNGATLRNALLAGNIFPVGGGDPDVSGVVTSLGYNLVGISDGSSGWNTGNGDLLGTGASPLDPVLGPLADNGGPTFTMALERGSPALNTGDPSLTGTDQRGEPRLSQGGVDIGAYEAYFPPEISVETSVGDDLTDGVSTLDLGYLILGTSTPETFFIGNALSSADLTGISVSIDDTGGLDVLVTLSPVGTVVSGASTSLGVTFQPNTTGPLTAALQIASNDADENPFDIAITAFGVNPGDSDGDGLDDIDELTTYGTDPGLFDTDDDGVGDGTEVNLAPLGFVNGADDSASLTLLQNNAIGLGLYSESNVQNLAFGQPLISLDQVTGKVTLRFTIQQAVALGIPWTSVPTMTVTFDPVTKEIVAVFDPPASDAFFFRLYGEEPIP